MADGRLDAGQLQLDPRDRCRRRRPLEPGEEESLDRLGVGGRLGEALLDDRAQQECPQGRTLRSSVSRRSARAAAMPRRCELIGERAGEPVEDEAERLETPRPAGSIGRARRSRSGARRGRNGSISSPRARAWSRPPSSPNRATSAVRGSSATAPIRRSPKRASRARMSGSGVSSDAGNGARNGASPPGGRSATRRRGVDRRRPSPRIASRRSPAAAPRAGSAASAADEAPDEDGLRTPQSLEPVDLDLDQAERGIGRVGRAGQPRAEPGERLEGGFDRRRVGLGSGSRKAASGASRWAAPERDPAPDAERPGRRIRVDHHPVRPRLSAEDDRPVGRERAGVAGPGEPEREMGPVEVEESHGS